MLCLKEIQTVYLSQTIQHSRIGDRTCSGETGTYPCTDSGIVESGRPSYSGEYRNDPIDYILDRIDRQIGPVVTIQPEALLPSFEALSTTGQSIRSVDYRQRKNLLLVFLDDPSQDYYLEELAAQARLFRACNGQVLAFTAHLSKAEVSYPFPVVADPERRFWKRFAIDASALVLTDLFSSIRKILWIPRSHPLPPVYEVVEWLEFIDMRCHECNIPLW